MKVARDEVALFLEGLRAALEKQSGVRVFFLKSEKTMASLAHLGFTIEAALDDIKKLRPEDYCAGPEPDDKGRPGAIWKFGSSVNKMEIYIKFADYRPESPRIVVISYHKAERPLVFPFRKPRRT